MLLYSPLSLRPSLSLRGLGEAEAILLLGFPTVLSLRGPRKWPVAISFFCGTYILVCTVPRYQRLPRRPKCGLLAMTRPHPVIARPRRGRSNLSFGVPRYQRLPRRPKCGLLAMTYGEHELLAMTYRDVGFSQ